jgi:hypothetical protein
MKMLRGATEIFSGIKGGALKVLDILRGGSKLFKVLVQQGPGVFTPTAIVNRIDGLETHEHINITHYLC